MNTQTTENTNKDMTKVLKSKNCCENIANSLSTFNRILFNTSNKLGLSKAIYQK